MTSRLLVFLWAVLLPLAGLCNTIAYFPDQASAFAACQSDGAIPGQACSPSGFALVRWCGTYNGCLGGCSVIEQTSQAPYPGGQCPYSVQTEYHAYTYPSVACPAGYTFTGPLGTDCIKPEKSQAVTASKPQLGGGSKFAATSCPTEKAASPAPIVVSDSSTVGNPCDASTGNKLQVETDFAGGFGIPAFQRTYNSLSTRDDGLGTGWSHSFNKRIFVVSATQLQYVAGNGSITTFTKSGSNWSGSADLKTKLTVTNGYYTFSSTDGNVEIFNPKGLPVSDTDPRGLTTSYVFSGDGLLQLVTGPFGHKITLTYGSNLTTATFPDGAWVKFAKDAKTNLVSATRSDTVVPAGVVTQYVYEDTANPHSLTGIVDSNGSRYATYAYDSTSGMAVSTQHASGTGKFTLAYNGNQTVITDAIGNTQTLTFTRNLGVNLLVGRTDSSDGKTRSQSFDAANNLISRTDEEGHITNFGWDGPHRLTSMTVAVGTGVERTTTYAYASPSLNLPTTITEPDRTTTIAYNGTLPTSITVSDGGSSRAISMTYTTKGQVATVSGPRVDVVDTRTLEYWDCTTGAQCGQLKKMNNALGHVTTFDLYDGAGRLLKSTSPNGMATTFAYNKAGNVTSVTETPLAGSGSPRNTSFTYDKEQHPLTVSLPGGVVLTYAYDAAHQLTSVADNLGNKLVYAYDLKGNRTQTVVKDASDTLQRQIDVAFSARNFVASVNAAGSITQVVSDAVGNPIAITDPNGHSTVTAFDALDRITQTVDRLGGVTALAYDAQGYLASVTAPNSAQTAYATTGLGDQMEETSPDRGSTARTFDAAGNVLTRMDARGITANFTYDALNRPASLTYPAGGEDVAYTWDSCANGKGRLCGVTDATGAWAYAYDGFGRLASVTWTSLGHVYTTSYAWNPDDSLASITYPSGRQISYTRNALGQNTAITTAGQNIVTGRSYRVDGLLKGQTYGNSLADARAYDAQGRLTMWTTGSVDSRTYGYDANGNITLIGASAFGYDWLDRLTAAPGQLFAYDPNSNRTADASGAWSYGSNTNRLVASPAGAITLDAAGNTLSDRGGNRTFAYNQGGRLISATVGGLLVGQYSYAFDGHRASKTASGATSVFHYDLDGRVIAETDASGTTLKEYVWDDDGRPLAQITGAAITYLHPDHLGTPRFGTDNARNTVWQWGDQSFGTTPSSGGITVNLRFDGQYADVETGLLQNWKRTYDPVGGRYLESDPIGLEGGINTYLYVEANPGRSTDRTGELAVIGAMIGGFGNLGYQLYQNGGNLSCVNWWQVGAWALTGSGAGIVGRAGLSGIGNFFWNSRRFSSISRSYWAARGGAGGMSLDHWAISQAAGRNGTVPQGLVNGGWNLLEMPGSWNTWLGFAPNWGGNQAMLANATRLGIQTGVPGIAATSGYAGYQLGTNAQQTNCGCQ